MPRRRKPASRMRPGRRRGRSRPPSTTGNTAAEPPPRSAATGSAVTARGRRGSSRTCLAVAGAPEAGRPALRARPGRQRGRSRAPRLGYNAAEPSSRSTGTGSGVTARGRCGRSRTPLTAGESSGPRPGQPRAAPGADGGEPRTPPGGPNHANIGHVGPPCGERRRPRRDRPPEPSSNTVQDSLCT